MEFIYILQRSEHLCELTINFVKQVGRGRMTEHSLAVKDSIPHCMCAQSATSKCLLSLLAVRRLISSAKCFRTRPFVGPVSRAPNCPALQQQRRRGSNRGRRGAGGTGCRAKSAVSCDVI